MKCGRLSIERALRDPELMLPERARGGGSCLCQLWMEHCCTQCSPENSRGPRMPLGKKIQRQLGMWFSWSAYLAYIEALGSSPSTK